METLFLDTETTGKYPGDAYDPDEALSVAIINAAGTVLLDTLVRPVRHTSWPGAQKVHGITPVQVLRDDVPTLADLTPQIAGLLRGNEVVIYNAAFDTQVLTEALALGPPSAVHCCMLAFSEHPEVRSWNDYHGNWRWHSLATAADRVGHVWTGAAHSALPDCYAARDVWAWLTNPGERARLEAAEAAEAERRLQQQVDWYLEYVWQRERENAQQWASMVNGAWEAQHYPAMGVREFRRPMERSARESADVFCQQLTGYPAEVWNRYGKLLKLRRYGQPSQPKRPKHLVSREDVYLLRPEDEVTPVAWWQKDAAFPRSQYGNYLTPLYNLKKLVLGVDYVPYCHDYQKGHCSKTALVRDHKLKPKEADQVPPAFRLLRQKYDDYLLYPIPAPISQPETPALVGTETHGE